MLAKDDDWLTAGNQLDDSLLMDDLWDDDADPQNDKGAASHSTGSAFPQDNAETLPQKAGGTGSSPNVPTVSQSNRESILGENANTFPQYFDDSFPQSGESTTHQSDSNPFQQEDVDPFQQDDRHLPTQEKEESFSRSNDSTVSRSNSAPLSQEDAETIPHYTEHTVPQSNKATDSQDNKGTASRPIRTTAPQNTVTPVQQDTVAPVQQDTADTSPQENAENLDQIDLLANGYDPFKEFADSAEDRNDKESEEQSAVSAFPQNNEETREQGKGPEEYDPFEQFDLQSDDSSEPPTEQNERRDDNIIQDSSADSKKNVDMQEQGDIEPVFPSNVPMQNQRGSETEEQYDSSSFQQEDSSPVRQDTGETYPKDTDSADPFDLWDDPSEPPEGEPQTSSPSAGSPSADDYPTQTFQTGDDFWSQTDDESNGQWNAGQQTNGMPPQQFDNPPFPQESVFPVEHQYDFPFPQENTDTENRENGGTLIKIIAVAAAILIGLGALIGGGAYTYHAYTTHVAEQQAEADRKQRQQSLVKAQNKWDGRKRKADDLVSTIKASPVAENSDVQKAVEALQKTTTGNPMTEKDITSALEKLDGEYEKTNRTYTDAMQAKAKETRTTLDGLVQQANGLADAPDGNDKKQMQSLASQWKSTEITSDNLSDAITASTELKNLISKVDKAKKDADAKKKAEEEAKAKAEAERQAQAQQEQQQAQQPQQNPYGNMYYWGGGYGSTGGSTGGPTGGSTGNSGGGVSPPPQQETPPKGNSGGNVG